MQMLHPGMIIAIGIVAIVSSLDMVFAQYGCPPIQGGGHPKISTNDNTVHVLWNYFYGCGQRLLLLRSSNDGGETFGNSVIVANASQAGSEPIVTTSNNNVYVAWTEYFANPEQILFNKSTDDGKSFGNAIKINSDKTGENQPQATSIIQQGNEIGIIWTGYVIGGNGSSVFLSKSLDGGRSFQTIVLSAATGDSFSPQVAQVGDKAYVLWGSVGSCDRNRHECPTYSYIVTIDLSNSFALGSITSLDQYGGRLAASGDDIYIAGIYGSSAGTNGITFLRSTNDGVSFEKPITLVSYQTNTNHLNGLALNVSGKNVYVTWYDFHSPETGAEIFMKASNDNGTTFGNTQVVDPTDFHLNGPEPPGFDLKTLAEGNNYYATWQSNTNLDQIGQGIFLRKSTDGGRTLDGATDLTGKIVISNPGYDFASDGNNIYIAGPDYAFKDSNHIMFSKSSDGGNSFSTQIDLDQNSISTVPEFPFAIPILLIGITSLLVFYRIRFGK
ncbi:MAG: sialidase family protein [Nitrosotalea sp.]